MKSILFALVKFITTIVDRKNKANAIMTKKSIFPNEIKEFPINI